MAYTSLHATERRLVTLFVGGAFIFLLIFEGIFLGGRIILENQFQKDDFEKTASRMMDRMHMTDDRMKGGRKIPLDISFVTIDASGQIMENRIGGNVEFGTFENILDTSFIVALPFGKTMSYSGYYVQKIPHPRDPMLQTLIIKSEGYDIDDILRDILRFLALDILILFPFWLMGRYFVREILKPVEENMDAMSHFIHDAGHELKTPLAIVSGNLQILRDMKGKDEELVETSISTLHSMGDSLDGLVELSGIKSSGKKEYINLLTSVEEVTKLYSQEQNKKNIDLSIDIKKDAKINMSPKHFSILLANLYKNAITYNKEGGSITISFQNKIIRIEDSGIGMKKEDLDKIFDRFFRVDRTGKYSGSGIGLALVDRIVRLYGWQITVESEFRKGTIFAIKTK